MKRRYVLEIVDINGRVLLKCILKKYFWNMWNAFLWLYGDQ